MPMILWLIWAGLLRMGDLIALPPTGLFIHPNEKTPQQAQPFWDRAPEGAYVSVGTVRGFMGAGASPAVTALYLVDQEPQVVLYNKIERALLEVSDLGDKTDYESVRYPKSYDTWKAKFTNGAKISKKSKETLTEDNYDWWIKNVVNNPNMIEFNEGRIGGDANYAKATDRLTDLQKLAKNGKIQVFQADLGDRKEMDRVFRHVNQNAGGVSVLDISNAWHPIYLKRSNLLSLLKRVKRARSTHKDAILLSTIPDSRSGSWFYFGETFSHLKPEEWIKQTERLDQLGEQSKLSGTLDSMPVEKHRLKAVSNKEPRSSPSQSSEKGSPNQKHTKVLGAKSMPIEKSNQDNVTLILDLLKRLGSDISDDEKIEILKQLQMQGSANHETVATILALRSAANSSVAAEMTKTLQLLAGVSCDAILGNMINLNVLKSVRAK